MKKYVPLLLLPLALATGMSLTAAESQYLPLSSQVVAQAPNLEANAQQFIDLMAAGNFTVALERYSSQVRETLTPETLQQNWQDITNSTGAFEGTVSTRVEPIDAANNLYAVVVTSEFENGTYELIVQMSGDGVVSLDATGAAVPTLGFNPGDPVARTTPGFGQQEVDQQRLVAIAAPISGGTAHRLLIVEQISDARKCWNESGSNPVIIDPLLVNFDFTGICGRSLDSNGYSIRVNGQDLGLRYTLRVVNRGGDLRLVGAPSNRREPELQIARANGATTNFAKLSLEPGWRFTKRTFGGRTLGHVYLTFEGTLPSPSPSPTPSPTPTPSPSPSRTPTPSPSPSPTPVTLSDIQGDIYANEIRQAVQTGFISGFEDNTFRPQVAVTREQLVSMVLDALRRVPQTNRSATAINIPSQISTSPYPDVNASRWSAAKIQAARDLNIVSGYDDGLFRPDQPVTRAEMMAVLRRAAEYGQTLQGRGRNLQATQQPRAFSDTSTHWSADLVSLMSSYCNVASPVNETGTAFAPTSPALRNYAAAATLRMFNCVRDPQPQ